ncbi:phosphatase PAP2 family protein [Stenotrophomonas sp. HITSZ_GD]|uniref:acid phosphatase n=1 Tax=Stenotrophomonas sp. HITSZ_GD TaxID=3037248 RepID=UPI00240E84AC|nr:phosphatase PAP2 family protein [Stenotrophomonas sp. HITSZ_GD]MDG2526209.1 phosphatase PAP2 family protein [Stenotrophomonas sp. HITSZ_GD]
MKPAAPRRFAALLVLPLLAACAASSPRAVPELKPGVPAGYLGRDLPDSRALLPPPPAPGSAAFAQDEAVHAAAQRLKDGPRYAQAARDADLSFPAASDNFACALGVPIDARSTPRLYLLLRRTLMDAGLGTYGAKDHYRRVRPFVVHDEPTCLPRDEAALRQDGSYPSGHTAIGWTWALVLTQVAPARADALLARGRQFGESRLVCNAHWQSDVLEGRAVAGGVFAKLQGNADFLADVAAARQELATATAAGKTPTRCDDEAAALATPVPGAL